jgi:hypothetical protein
MRLLRLALLPSVLLMLGGFSMTPTASNLLNDSSCNAREAIEFENQSTELKWNYFGSISKYPIKAYIEYGPAEHSPTGALNVPIRGYYFYDKIKVKIPLNGYCKGNGLIYLTAHTKTGEESFDGEFTESMLMDFKGVWTSGTKSLPFNLISRDK